ncbi:histidine triad nucleotide-binding protein [Pseudidiomarina terrestris]|uniref:Histidine triad nucleotide-binding protein n=1 Tax=Pseudidiomarina terrestris TaxID=2820060 RepID=A0AAW7QXQ6_9GAMM|nr:MULTISPECIES: histidine triad nucleotide-binding protein [unclassified Pseudidiomarina]MDN7124242.1 histidine triad nucleotide-binding protein [Pseudidiomarina sp. 1APP75-32.1]MDN7127309.1 histidine triad nucleotide-binding protein [Pseudidiomarina sp. 1APR75-33.1]MDN7128499.1 histidine triad nucleotide-binding protein [Pseudidiomarina sp. 1APR75-15]MDN7135253.1 histidine triad nucleotide-binding protein [Pseudidiomarina sp. 1ASP75-5]MDN7138688.1 histidine triad nucleotide-binding protein [
MTTETIFDKIIRNEIPADIVYEDDISLAFKDVNPQAPVHLLIIPKKRIATVNDIQEDERELVGHLFVVARKIAVQHGFAKDGYRLVMNCNDDGGQSVYHIHLHLLAGQTLGWPPFANAEPKQG